MKSCFFIGFPIKNELLWEAVCSKNIIIVMVSIRGHEMKR